MTGIETTAWIEVGMHFAEIAGGIAGFAAMITITLIRHTYATKTEVEKRLADHEAKHEELETRLTEGDRTMTVLRADLGHLPNHNDLGELKDSIGDVATGVGGLAATMEAVKEQMKGLQGSFEKLLYHQMDREGA